MQQIGETTEAILKDDNLMLERILSANSGLKEPYWIVIFAKPIKNTYKGKPIIAKHFKAYKTKPSSQVGMIVGEVNNKKGTISWEINMPEKPFDFNKIYTLGAKESSEVIFETSTIPDAYITK